MIDPEIFDNEALKPAARILVERITGVLTEPLRIRRIAKAEADAMKIISKGEAEAETIKVKSEIEISELRYRALQRFCSEEMIMQVNLEETINKAIGGIHEDAKPQEMDQDWIFNYLVSCKMVSDSKMQDLWAKILAGEANEPGSFSKRTVNYMKDISKNDAELIESLCNFTWVVNDEDMHSVPLILEPHNYSEIYTKNNIDFWKIKYLEEIDIVEVIMSSFAPNPWKMKVYPSGNNHITYHGREIKLRIPEQESRYDDGIHRISLGFVRFTSLGEQLLKICNIKPIDGFYEYVEKKWHDNFTTLTPDEIRRKHNQ